MADEDEAECAWLSELDELIDDIARSNDACWNAD